MKKATISELKNRLSAYLRIVRAGEPVLILDRDVVVARVDRVDQQEHSEDRILRLERAGHLRAARKVLPREILEEPPVKSKKSVLEALIEERREGR